MSLEPIDPAGLDAFEQQYPTIGRWLRLLVGWSKPEAWREIGDTAGKNPAFESSWVNFDSGTHAQAAFYKNPLGTVYIKGLVKTGTLNFAIFTLPSGYRPSEKLHFSTTSNSLFGNLTVSANGEVRLEQGSNVWASINCSFRIGA